MDKITEKAGYITWSINLSDMKKCAMLLPENAQGLLLCDGAVQDTILPASKYVYKRDKSVSAAELVLVSKLPVELKWGIFDVPYTDYESKAYALCGICGTISIRVFNGQSVFRYFGKNVSVEELADKTIDSVKMAIEDAFKEVLNDNSFGRPDISGDKKIALVKKATLKLEDIFSDNGMEVVNITLNKLIVNDEYNQKRQEWEDRKDEKQKINDDLRKMEQIKEVLGGQSTPAAPKEKIVVCHKCHTEHAVGTRFCSNCGQKLY